MIAERQPIPPAPAVPRAGRAAVLGDWPRLVAGGAIRVLAACPPERLARLAIDPGCGSILRPAQARVTLLGLMARVGARVSEAARRRFEAPLITGEPF